MKRTRSDWGEAGFVVRTLFRVVSNPVLSVGIMGLLMVALLLVPRTGEIVFLGSVLWPALAFAVLILALPTAGATVRSFSLEEETRRNHALEHGTIYFLRKKYGKRYKLSGSSETRGFRVAGARTPADIEGAFRDLMREIKSGNKSVVVARRCGSNIVTAQAIGLTLLLSLALSFLFTSPAPLTIISSVAGVIIVVALVRYPVGMRIQAHRFLLLDFEEAVIESISPVKRAKMFERHPVYFVKTRVKVAPRICLPPNPPLNPTGAKNAPAG